MDRRQFLGTGLVLLAGCSQSTPSEPSTESAADTAEARTQAPSGSPSRQRSGWLEVEMGTMRYTPELRYYDSTSDSLELLQSREDWWIQQSIRFRNLGGSTLEIPSINNFSVMAGGEEHDLRYGLGRGDVLVDDLRFREQNEWWQDVVLGAEGSIEGGDIDSAAPLGEIPRSQNPTIVWETDEDRYELSPTQLLAPGESGLS